MEQSNLLGQTVLGYEVKEKIHSGSFGTVYKVVKTNYFSGQYERALKHIVIPTQRQYNSVLNSMGGDVSKTNDYFAAKLKEIISEINILNELSEKDALHIVRYYENDIKFTESPLRYDVFILMEYLTPLEDYISQNDFTVNDVVNLGLSVLKGLNSCHENGIIHRDIKDGNIFVSSASGYKIGDFGVSKVLKGTEEALSLKGTPNFFAPEIYRNEGSYTKSMDLYALGIVLYRLLNYGRNPFLPNYPALYNAQDEETAFLTRMRGDIPDLPSLGGSAIGNVVVKSLLDSKSRFQTAEEFFIELKAASESSSSDVLNQKVNSINISNDTLSENDSRTRTLEDVIPDKSVDYKATVEPKSEVTKDIFETQSETNLNIGRSDEKSPEAGSNEIEPRIISPTPENITTDSVEVLDRNILNKFVFLLPVLIFFIGLTGYFVIIPSLYGRTVSFFDWLFSDSQTIINTLRDSNAVLPQVHSVVAIGIFWWIWLATFIASLFFVGRRLNSVTESHSINAKMKNKEPYFFIHDVSEAVKMIQSRKNCRELDDFIHALNNLEGRLSLESDFGYGDAKVIDCENKITEQLQTLKNFVSNVEKGNFIDNLNKMSVIVVTINSMILKRANLKKRYDT